MIESMIKRCVHWLNVVSCGFDGFDHGLRFQENRSNNVDVKFK